MVLKGRKKEILQELVRYFVSTTGNKNDKFIVSIANSVLKSSSELCYSEWLANKSFEILKENGITMQDCIENKDVINSATNSKSSRTEGEFYTPAVWAKEGIKYLKETLGDLWGNAYIWDASCYSMDTLIFVKSRKWVTYNDLTDSDKVLSMNPHTLELEYVGFNRRFEKESNEFLIVYSEKRIQYGSHSRVETIDLKVTLNHKMCVRLNGVITLLSAYDLYERLENVFKAEGVKGKTTFEIPVYVENYKDNPLDKVLQFIPIDYRDCRVEKSESEKVWDITLDKNHVFLVKKGYSEVFCGNCGTGNLLQSEKYPSDKLFLSTLLQEDVDLVKESYVGSEVFQLDFLAGIDWDSKNMLFSKKLPQKLLYVLENNLPLVFYMNPPYKVMKADNTDVGGYMKAHGLSRCAVDIFSQFMYRLVLLKRTYNLTNLYAGIFGPVTMYHSSMLEPLYNEFKEVFIFDRGMCFDGGEFSGTSNSVGWVVGYTVWKPNLADNQANSVLLDAKSVDDNGDVVLVGKRLVRSVDQDIRSWVLPKGIISNNITLPVISTFKTFTGDVQTANTDSLGHIMDSNYTIRAVRRASVMSLPSPDNIQITEENFWRCVASFAARRAYATSQNPYNNSQYFSMPDTEVEGYSDWLIDALVLFLFDNASHFASYRNVDFDGELLTVRNKMFPIAHDVVKMVVTDPVILQDMNENPPENAFILKVLQENQSKFSEDALELYSFCIETLLESLTQDVRKDLGYENWLNAWDAGFAQVRYSKWFSGENKEKYSYLQLKLKSRLLSGVYKFGFIMDVQNYNDFDQPTQDSEDESYEDLGVDLPW